MFRAYNNNDAFVIVGLVGKDLEWVLVQVVGNCSWRLIGSSMIALLGALIMLLLHGVITKT